MKGVGHVGAALHQNLQKSTSAHFVQDLAEIAGHLRAGLNSGLRTRSAEDDALRLPRQRVGSGKPDRQLGIIQSHRSCAHHDRIAVGAEVMHVESSLFAGNPTTGPIRRRGSAIEGCSHLEHDVRTLRTAMA